MSKSPGSTVWAAGTGVLPRPIRVGLVGVGNWALYAHVRVLNLMPQYEMAVVYSQRPEAAKAAAAEFGIKRVAASLDELVQDPEVDLVLVLTTGPQHEVAVRAAIAAGKDIYCEWPLTPELKTSVEMTQLAKAAGVRTLLGVQRGYAPAFRYLKDLIDDKYAGKIRSVRMHVSVSTFGRIRGNAIRWSVLPETFMGVVSIFGAHFLGPLFGVVGRPDTLSAVLVNQFPEVTIAETGEVFKTAVPDQLMMTGQLHGGAPYTVHIEGGKHNGPGVRLDITGDAGDLQLVNTHAHGGAEDLYQVHGAQGEVGALALLPIPASYHWLPPSEMAGFVLELGDYYEVYARHLATGSPAPPSFDDAVWMQSLLILAAESSQSGRRVSAPRFPPAPLRANGIGSPPPD
jgi:predicted dehydrogenase